MTAEPPDDTTEAAPSATPEGERIAKRLARAGLCSRRDAERWIAEGRVKVNGQVLDSPAFNVKPGDRILVDNTPVPDPEPTRVWRYHKPEGLVTTARDEKGRATVFDRLPPELPRVVSVGRLDLSSEGLLLLTNDGELARHLELPSTGWVRRYRVRVYGFPAPETLAALKNGVTVDGVSYGPIEAELERQVGSNAWLIVGLREGKNREVRKVMEYLGLPVSRLIRTAYGPFQLGKLDIGAVEEVPRRVLRDQLPTFFGKEEPGAPSATAKRATMRYDRLPKAKAATAPSSATKGPVQGAAKTAPKTTDAAAPAGRKPRATPRPAQVPEELLRPDGPAKRSSRPRPTAPGVRPGGKGETGKAGTKPGGKGGTKTGSRPGGRQGRPGADRRR